MAEATGTNRLTRKEQQARTRDALLEAAEKVFLRRGFAGSSVEEIASEAGFTRGAFYSNFRSKEQLFVELLHDRVYSGYREMLETSEPEGVRNARDRLLWGAEQVRDTYKQEDGRWLFRLWLECLTQAARDEGFRQLAATFWSGSRGLMEHQLAETFKEQGRKPQIPPKDLATAMIAIDIGLAVQHLVDPEAVPLDLYVPVYDLLFGELAEPDAKPRRVRKS